MLHEQVVRFRYVPLYKLETFLVFQQFIYPLHSSWSEKNYVNYEFTKLIKRKHFSLSVIIWLGGKFSTMQRKP